MSAHKAKPKTRVKVTVTFPISPRGPYRAEESPDTTIGSIRDAAMSFFGVASDGQHAYFVTHAGDRLADDATVGDLAGHAAALKLTLIKELLQGRR